jgi:hypothetical protein
MPIEQALPIPCPLRRWRGILTYLRALLTLPVGLHARHSTEEWCFGNAPDDPEDAEVLREVQDAATGDADIHVLLLPPFGDLEINARVRGSTVVLQKSVREGFT